MRRPWAASPTASPRNRCSSMASPPSPWRRGRAISTCSCSDPAAMARSRAPCWAASPPASWPRPPAPSSWSRGAPDSPRSRRSPGLASDPLGNHLDRPAGALGHAEAAALAEVEVDLVAVHVRVRRLGELQYRVVRTDAVAVVAGEAVAAGHAPPRLVERVGLVQALDDLLEGPAPPLDLELRLHGPRSVRVVPRVELVEGGELVLGRMAVGLAAEPAVDVARRLLAVPDADSDRPLGGHHVAAREDPRVPGHHVVPNLDDPVGDLDALDTLEQREVGLLAQGEDDRVRLQLLDLAGGLREARLVELHLLHHHLAAVDLLDGLQPAHHD